MWIVSVLMWIVSVPLGKRRPRPNMDRCAAEVWKVNEEDIALSTPRRARHEDAERMLRPPYVMR